PPDPSPMTFNCDRCGNPYEVQSERLSITGVMVECPSCGAATLARPVVATEGWPSAEEDEPELPAPVGYHDAELPAPKGYFEPDLLAPRERAAPDPPAARE